ncbi:MAG: YHS domain protein [Nitrospirae bacterium]|nr:YHS domain protein [Nitrospirota bacterium]
MAIAIFYTLFSCVKSVSVPPVNVTDEGLAIKGYDPVAYFTDKRPIEGMSEFKYVWKGAVWRFASSAHLEMFKKDAEKYAPMYGGYCAYAVSQGKTADIDPASWTIFEDRLYLNLNKDVQMLWEKDMQAYIKKADENWPRMLRKK